MKIKLMIVIASSLVICANAYSNDYVVKDLKDNQTFHIKGKHIVDKNWNKKFTIKKDGTIVDNNWNKVGKIEKRK